MIFDKNQSAFPSDLHREVWWWAVGLVPPSDSLTNAVKNQCTKDILDGCYQWYDYFNELCEDMYNHMDMYQPAPVRQYRDILENIAACGEIQGNTIVRNINEWHKYSEKLNKSKAYANLKITLENCLTALERTGLTHEYRDDTIVFSNAKYPKIFHAMNTFEHSPNIRKTPARHHFAHCEFRQLFKSYSASYDELLRRVSDESHDIAHAIHDFAKSLKIQRYIHFDTIKYKHKNIRVLDFTVSGGEYPALRVNIGTCAKPDSDVFNDTFYKHISAADNNIQDIFIKNLERCGNEAHNHQTVKINGKNERVCPNSRIRINPFRDDLDAILCFIAARKASIDQYII
ncbi:MAG: hypothetical protein FWD71_19525 [Oscillospiraceae bacterium]|nr:hypothetical protein [Oscillospiraceae bacterium]